MACAKPALQCLIEDIRPYLARASDHKDKDGKAGYHALCPAHDDQRKSLSIHEGRHKRVVWVCGAGCGEVRVRHALIQSGVKAACLPLSADASRDLVERIWAVATDKDLGHAAARLRILALLDQPRGELPRGAALDALAAAAGVSRRAAYAERSRFPRQPE